MCKSHEGKEKVREDYQQVKCRNTLLEEPERGEIMKYRDKKLIADNIIVAYLDEAYKSFNEDCSKSVYNLTSQERNEVRTTLLKKIRSIKLRYKLDK